VFSLDRNHLVILLGDQLRPCLVLACLLGALDFVAVWVPQTSAQVDRAERVQWIDVHVHPLGRRGSHTYYDAAVKFAVSAMQESGIAKMILMPPPQVDGTTPPFDF
jgi:hypothetical protein